MAMENTNTKILVMRGITKKFGPVTVLDNVDCDVERGEVLALVGANGAGKSTLMKILNGRAARYSALPWSRKHRHFWTR